MLPPNGPLEYLLWGIILIFIGYVGFRAAPEASGNGLETLGCMFLSLISLIAGIGIFLFAILAFIEVVFFGLPFR